MQICLFVANLHLRVCKSKLQINTDWLLIKKTQFFVQLCLCVCVLNQMLDYNFTKCGWCLKVMQKYPCFSAKQQIEIHLFFQLTDLCFNLQHEFAYMFIGNKFSLASIRTRRNSGKIETQT